MNLATKKTCHNCATWNAVRCGFDPGCDDWTPDCVTWFDPSAVPPPPGDIVGLSKDGTRMIGEYHKGALICTGYTLEHVIAWAEPLPVPEGMT